MRCNVMLPFAPNRMVLSKLDEVRSLGELFPILSHSQLPISYVTTGQNVPEDIEAAQRTRLAAFLLGQCVEFAATGRVYRRLAKNLT